MKQLQLKNKLQIITESNIVIVDIFTYYHLRFNSLLVDTNGNGTATIQGAKDAGYSIPITKDHWLYIYLMIGYLFEPLNRLLSIMRLPNTKPGVLLNLALGIISFFICSLKISVHF